MKFAEIKNKIVNNQGFNSIKEIKHAGCRLVKERDGERYLLVINPYKLNIKDDLKLNKLFNRQIKSIFEECGFNPRLPIRDQEPNLLSDRKELDDIIFDILGLTKEERKEVYWAVCELVKNRLEKARSV